MKYIDIFKYYSFDKLDNQHKYFEIKKNNYEKVRNAYFNDYSVLDCFPIRATIQTTENCNLNCIMCQIHGNPLNRKILSMKKTDFEIITEQLFPYLIEVHPTNIGEALISPWFDYFVKKVIEYGVLLDLTTNGMLLNDTVILKILPNLLDVKISFDSLKKETFENIRRKSNFETIIKNIDTLVRLRNETGSSGTVTLQMTLMKMNYKELPAIIKYASEKSIDRVKAYHVFSYSNQIREQSLLWDLSDFESIRLESIDLAKKLNIGLEISEPKMEEIKLDDLIYQKCRLLWTECWIDTDGSVYTCHSHNNIAMGNINENTFKKIWNSKKILELRNGQNLNKPTGICNNCGMNYLKKNENQKVPYDIKGYFTDSVNEKNIKWSNRSKQFLLKI